ncbi:MAG: SDR family NAD(P)-dependent oxidoreductase [Magnetovibrionaceae bacterium]
MQLVDQTVLVTGGASGLGEATARAFAAQGAKVALLDRDETGLARVASETGAEAFGCDITEAASTETAFRNLIDRLGPPRVAVNCAGIAPPKKIVGRDGPQPLETFQATINVNLVGTFNVLRLAAAAMCAEDPLEGERGVIINTASIAGYEGQIGQAAYAASKAGVIGLTLPAARELASKAVRVVAIAPGLFETPMMAGLPENVRVDLGQSVPYPSRLGLPDEFAALVCHIVANRMINGEVIRLDGALRMPPA